MPSIELAPAAASPVTAKATVSFESAAVNDGGKRQREPLIRGGRQESLSNKEAPAQRLIARGQPFHQSEGKFRLSRSDPRFFWWFLLKAKHWVALGMQMPTTAILLFIACTYTLLVVLFASIYIALASSNECAIGDGDGDDALDFHAAFAFSLETSSTIGYGFPGDRGTTAYFRTCGALTTVVHIQWVLFTMGESRPPAPQRSRTRAHESLEVQHANPLSPSLCSSPRSSLASRQVDAACIGLLFVRLSRGTTKAAQIVFSDQAVIRCVNGRFHFTFRVGELSFFTYHPVLSPRACVYALVQPQQGGGGGSRTGAPRPPRRPPLPSPPPPPGFPLPKNYPGLERSSDSFQSSLLRHTTNSVRSLFAADQSSGGSGRPLRLRPMNIRSNLEPRGLGFPHGRLGGSFLFLAVPQTLSHTVNAGSPLHPGPSEQAMDELPGGGAEGAAGDVGSQGGGSSRSDDVAGLAAEGDEQSKLLRLRSRIAEHIRATALEVIITLDATDPLTGSAFQARHSYTADDIVFDAAFQPALRRDDNGRAAIDWSYFHALRPTGFNETTEDGEIEQREADEADEGRDES
jgi:hypothetical protein